MSRPAVANIEAGRQRVLLHQFVALCEALDPPNLEDVCHLFTQGAINDPKRRREVLTKIGALQPKEQP